MSKLCDEFILRVESQDWLNKEFADYDLCSHGQIYLKVNGIVITSSEMDEWWGISESALSLLKT